jgi:regulator of protease activity HflC (stomatin/prohibitin superfamily)
VTDLCYDPAVLKTTSKDGVEVGVDLVLYFRISDVSKAVLGVNNLFNALENRIVTAAFDAVGQLTLDELCSSSVRDLMRTHELTREVQDWGLSINRLDVQGIVLPREIRDATVKSLAAKRQAEVELAALENEHKRKVRMAKSEAEEQEVRQQREKAMFDHENSVMRAKAAAEADVEAVKARADLAALSARREAEIAFLERELESFAKHPESFRFFEKQVASDAWKKIGSSSSSRVVLAPLDTLQLAAHQPVLHALSSSTADASAAASDDTARAVSSS